MKKKIIAMLLSVVMAVSLTACGSGSGAGKEKDTNISSELTYDHSMELTYAEEFSVDYYNDGYALATVADDGRYLIVPEGKEAPDDLAKDITAKSVESVRIFFQANKELRITKSATREDEKLDLISLDEYLKKNSVVVSPEDPENPGEGGGEGGGGVTPDPSV